jgi:cell fate (sporulation/competence/biofilm development) regulator YlbF (YheA/YmcA/DUF963 family)
MNDIELTELDATPPAVVHTTARDFAVALAETPQFKTFEQANEALNNDVSALQALSAYQAKVKSLRALLMLNAVSEVDQAELERLKNAYVTRSTVQAYAVAEAELTSLCQQAAELISEAIGLNYAAACGASCCG